jgi:hypothetical protein
MQQQHTYALLIRNLAIFVPATGFVELVDVWTRCCSDVFEDRNANTKQLLRTDRCKPTKLPELARQAKQKRRASRAGTIRTAWRHKGFAGTNM